MNGPRSTARFPCNGICPVSGAGCIIGGDCRDLGCPADRPKTVAYARGVVALAAPPEAPRSADQERERFEQWAAKEGYPTRLVRGGVGLDGNPVYDDQRTHAAWWAWQARAAHQEASPASDAPDAS